MHVLSSFLEFNIHAVFSITLAIIRSNYAKKFYALECKFLMLSVAVHGVPENVLDFVY